MYYIGIDLGGTNIAGAVLNSDKEIIVKQSVKTPVKDGADAIVDEIYKLSLSLTQELELDYSEIIAIGIGAPGTVDIKTGVVVRAGNIDFNNFPLREKLIKKSGKPVAVDNDANCAAFGEYMSYETKPESMVLLTLGTGVGGGIVLDGRIYGGFHNLGAELGHIVIQKDGRQCPCGQKGCLEAYASATALSTATKEVFLKNSSPLLKNLCENDIEEINAKTAFSAAAKGDSAAALIIEEYIDHLSTGVASIINAFYPEVIVIGGGVSHEGDALINPLRAQVPGKLFVRNTIHNVKIERARLGNDAGIIGAGLLVLQA